MIDLIPGDKLSQDLIAEVLAMMVQWLDETEEQEELEQQEESELIYLQVKDKQLAI